MAKVTAAFLGLGASGTLGNTLTASTWKGIPVMKLKPTPTNPKSDGQVGHRTLFSCAAAIGRTLTIPQQALWQATIAGMAQTWFNAIISMASKNWKKGLGPQLLPTRVDDTAPGPPTALAATLHGSTVRLTWTAPADADKECYLIFRSPTTGVSDVESELKGFTLTPIISFDDLPGSGTWYYTAVCVDVDGNKSTIATETSIVVP